MPDNKTAIEVFAKHLPGVFPRVQDGGVIMADLGGGYTLTASDHIGRWDFCLWSEWDGLLTHRADKHWDSDDFEECLKHFLRCVQGLWESPMTLWGQIQALIEEHPGLEGASLHHDGSVTWEHRGPLVRGMTSTTGVGADSLIEALRGMQDWLARRAAETSESAAETSDLGSLINDAVAQ